jgi:hypothetical protein
MASIGPVEYVVIEFPGNRFKGEIVPAIAELVDNGVGHILDVLFIKKDADGTVTGFEYEALDDVLEFGFAEIEGEPEITSTTRTWPWRPRSWSRTARWR